MSMFPQLLFDCVRNGDSDKFPTSAWRILLLDGFPRLLHIIDGMRYTRLASFKGGKLYQEVDLPERTSCRIGTFSDGKAYLTDLSNSEGFLLAYANESFKVEKVAFPKGIDIVSFYRVHDSTYFVAKKNSDFHVFSADTRTSPFIIPNAASNEFSSYFTIEITALKGTPQTKSVLFYDVPEAVTSLDDRWLIIVGHSHVGILDVQTMQLETFSYSHLAGRNNIHCVARKVGSAAELFVSATGLGNGVCRIYKTFLPLRGIADEDLKISPFEEENAALKLEISDVKLKNAKLEEDKKVLEEKMADLERKYTKMMLTMTKK